MDASQFSGGVTINAEQRKQLGLPSESGLKELTRCCDRRYAVWPRTKGGRLIAQVFWEQTVRHSAYPLQASDVWVLATWRALCHRENWPHGLLAPCDPAFIEVEVPRGWRLSPAGVLEARKMVWGADPGVSEPRVSPDAARFMVASSDAESLVSQMVDLFSEHMLREVKA